jgi:hypothetical protein
VCRIYLRSEESERNGLPRRHARHHVLSLIQLFFYLQYLASLTASCSTQDFLQATTQDEYDLRVPITLPPSPSLTPPRFHSFFLSPTPLVSRSRITLTDTMPPCRSRTLPPSHLFVRTAPLYIPRHARGRRTIQNLDSQRSSAHVFKTTLLLVKEGTIASTVFEPRSPFFLLYFHLHTFLGSSLSVIVRWNLCPHDLDRSLAFSVNPSFLSLVVFSYFPPSLILDDIPLSQRLSKLQSIWCSRANAGYLV